MSAASRRSAAISCWTTRRADLRATRSGGRRVPDRVLRRENGAELGGWETGDRLDLLEDRAHGPALLFTHGGRRRRFVGSPQHAEGGAQPQGGIHQAVIVLRS